MKPNTTINFLPLTVEESTTDIGNVISYILKFAKLTVGRIHSKKNADYIIEAANNYEKSIELLNLCFSKLKDKKILLENDENEIIKFLE